jgi:hypothetical protein
MEWATFGGIFFTNWSGHTARLKVSAYTLKNSPQGSCLITFSQREEVKNLSQNGIFYFKDWHLAVEHFRQPLPPQQTQALQPFYSNIQLILIYLRWTVAPRLPGLPCDLHYSLFSLLFAGTSQRGWGEASHGWTLPGDNSVWDVQ